MEQTAAGRKWRMRIGYGVGDLGCNLVFSTMASYLMIFYTDVFGISAAVAGTLMLVTKFIDALTDTGMGLIIGLAVTGLGIYGIFGTTFAIQPDVIDYSEYKKNKSVSGLIAAFQGFFVKASMGLASAVIGLILKYGGYVANEAQSEQALRCIEASFIWIPIGLCVLIAGFMIFYKLDGERHNMDVELEKRRQALL